MTTAWTIAQVVFDAGLAVVLVVLGAKLTRTTEEIKAQISSSVWDRQRRWELKREVLFQATKRIADLEDALLSLARTVKAHMADLEEDGRDPNDAMGYTSQWHDALAAFAETQLFAKIICEKSTAKAFEDFSAFMTVVSIRIAEKLDTTAYRNSTDERRRLRQVAEAAIRKELGIDTVQTQAGNPE